MLLELHIENFAIIDKLHVEFSKGFNVLTGETGAGKSILIDALSLALGSKSSSEMIRSDAEKAVVEIRVDVQENETVRTKAVELGFLSPSEESQELIIRREISRSGKGRALINGNLATTAMLAELGENLIDIHGQHQHQSLLKPSIHIDLLDAFGGLLKLRKEFEEKFQRFKQVQTELRELKESIRTRMQRLDLLNFQKQEIEKAHLIPGEDEELQRERKLLSAAERLATETQEAYELLYGGEESLVDRLGQVLNLLKDLTQIDDSLSPLLSSCESIGYQLEDIAYSLRDYAQKVEFNPQRLEEIERRLDELHRLKRKYGNTLSDILDLKKSIEEELASYDEGEERLEKLENTFRNLEEELRMRAEELSRRRQEVAKNMELLVMKELGELNMDKTRFQITLEPGNSGEYPFTSKGKDRVEFFMAPNPGEDLKPLSKIASGGEISRIMLAFKTILASVDNVSTLIFDEVDLGIGGRIAEMVGKKLKFISSSRQVICITHLPQIASKADLHLQISKEVQGGKTLTKVRRLSESERIEEIARMLGGETITETTLKHAREMLGY
ncbi:MAG TPA: DNA repair protein RecN [Candidatus Limnocylindrales bacterium]|nr:DNA repair protein RecN [Candidatus Limnocylindrales bacterium]